MLKGPQGTLFGRNTTGGAVLIEPQRPTSDFGGSASLEVGNYALHSETGVLNVPLADSLAVRVAAKATDHDGYTTNRLTGGKLDDEDTKSARIGLLWKPTESIDSYTLYQWFQARNSGQGWRLVTINPRGAAFTSPANLTGAQTLLTMQQTLAALQAGDWHSVMDDQPLHERVDTWSLSNTTSWKVGGVTLKNIIGYRDVKTDASFDFDGSAARVNLPSGANVGVFNSRNLLEGNQFSNESQVLGSSADGALDWIGGLFYFRETNTDQQFSDLLGRRASIGTARNESKSAFAQASYHLPAVRGLSITGGYRHTWDDRELRSGNLIQQPAEPALRCALLDSNSLPISPCSRDSSVKANAGTYLIGVDWQLTDAVLVYLAHRHGYRSGGLNLRATRPTDPASFKPEYVDDAELGTKATFNLGDMRVRTNVAIFGQKYKDIQRTVSYIPAGATSISTLAVNAASATITGGEFEVTLIPIDRLELSGFFGYTDARYDKFDVAGIPPAALPIPGRPLKDNDFALVPKESANASIRYLLPMPRAWGDLAAQFSWYYQSESQISDINEPHAVLPSYSLYNASLDWQSVFDGPVDARLWIRNLTNKEYAISGVSVWTTGFAVRTLGIPRTYGLELRYRFGAH